MDEKADGSDVVLGNKKAETSNEGQNSLKRSQVAVKADSVPHRQVKIRHSVGFEIEAFQRSFVDFGLVYSNICPAAETPVWSTGAREVGNLLLGQVQQLEAINTCVGAKLLSGRCR